MYAPLMVTQSMRRRRSWCCTLQLISLSWVALHCCSSLAQLKTPPSSLPASLVHSAAQKGFDLQGCFFHEGCSRRSLATFFGTAVAMSPTEPAKAVDTLSGCLQLSEVLPNPAQDEVDLERFTLPRRPPTSLWDFTGFVDGKEVQLSEFKSKANLVVNVASE
eukprot:TRINITY_DN38416_c0_g1_i3.p1 TRINITY_DN38416_c0_g1~~TRINITY_DN38416_c0_g1_i3.p1  ORF type:complete len:162 (-),score=17.63 TRINITY_DN38416_c0_g1_i3:763-1248(-)